MTINSSLNLDLDCYNEIVDYYLDFLHEFSSNNFPYEKRVQLKGIATKFIDSIYQGVFLLKEKKDEYFELINTFKQGLIKLDEVENRSPIIKLFLPTINSGRLKRDFEKLYSMTLDLINDLNKNLEIKV